MNQVVGICSLSHRRTMPGHADLAREKPAGNVARAVLAAIRPQPSGHRIDVDAKGAKDFLLAAGCVRANWRRRRPTPRRSAISAGTARRPFPASAPRHRGPRPPEDLCITHPPCRAPALPAGRSPRNFGRGRRHWQARGRYQRARGDRPCWNGKSKTRAEL